MKISLKCFAKVSEANVCDFRDGDDREVSEGETVKSLIKRLGFPLEDIKIVFVNRKKVDLDTVLSNGDRLGLRQPRPDDQGEKSSGTSAPVRLFRDRKGRKANAPLADYRRHPLPQGPSSIPFGNGLMIIMAGPWPLP